jgi:hypothetical protein
MINMDEITELSNLYCDTGKEIKRLQKLSGELLEQIWLKKYHVKVGSIIEEKAGWATPKNRILRVATMRPKYGTDTSKPRIRGYLQKKDGTFSTKRTTDVYGEYEVVTE